MFLVLHNVIVVGCLGYVSPAVRPLAKDETLPETADTKTTEKVRFHLLLQWNLRIMDTFGTSVLFRCCPFFGGGQGVNSVSIVAVFPPEGERGVQHPPLYGVHAAKDSSIS